MLYLSVKSTFYEAFRWTFIKKNIAICTIAFLHKHSGLKFNITP